MTVDIVKASIWLIDPAACGQIKDGKVPYYAVDSPYSTMNTHGWIKVGIFEMQVPRPSEEEARLAFITGLELKKKELLVEAHAKAQRIDDTINQLLSLTYEPTREIDDDIPF